MEKIDLELLKDRSLMLKKVRSFFLKRKFLEVDTPSLLQKPSVDQHIDVLKTKASDHLPAYLATSPEYCLKRLLVKDVGDIYQMSHVFRFGELGSLHNPEFMMIEWYRKNISYSAFLKELIALISLFLGKKPSQRSSYRKIFLKHTKLDPFLSSTKDLYRFIKKKISPSLSSMPDDIDLWDKDTLLNFIMSTFIEKHLGKNNFVILDEYPASQAALAKTKLKNQQKIAERFEIYYQGLELANGYHELFDLNTIRKRFFEANQKRKKGQKEVLPLDEKFLKSLGLAKNLKSCYGVAVGFDRLMMLRHKKQQIKTILPFAFDET